MNVLSSSRIQPVSIADGASALPGVLALPPEARGLVLFVHSSGSNRNSPRDQLLAAHFQKEDLATLRFDQFTQSERDAGMDAHADLPCAAERVAVAAQWLRSQALTGKLPMACMAAGAGAAAALIAASRHPELFKSLICRGGRLDLADEALPQVQPPTLLLVGGADPETLASNQQALARLRCVKKLTLIPGAGHLFEEPGALGHVAKLTLLWLDAYLPALPPASW